MTSVDSQAFRGTGSWSRPSRLSLSLLASVALLAGRGYPALAQPLPSGPTVAAGSASISTPSGTSLIVEQSSPNAVINWQSFSIGAGNTVHVNNGSGATLNRVTGNVPSRLDGSLTATGSVYLINPAGVAVGPGGRVATGGSFVASTLDVRDAAFLAGGDKTFSGTSKATVTNAGSIGSLGGDVALIARAVGNTGTITAPKGTAALAAGYEVLARDGAVNGGKFQVRIGGADTEAKTTGTITAAVAELRANGGNVYALAGNTGGVIAATGTSASGGRIYLTAGDDGAVEAGGTITATRTMGDGARQGGDIRVSGGRATVTGTLTAKGSAPPTPGVKPVRGAGGSVAVTGRAVTVAGAATVDASGTSGGAVVIGGDYQGGKDARTKTLAETVANAATTTVETGARLSADGSAGDGGSVVVWADERTLFGGTISARGNGVGRNGIAGDGGRAEVSGKASLSFQGTVDLRAESGRTGSLLLDPYNLTIASGADSGMSGFNAAGDDSVLNVGTLTAALATANVTVSTGSGGSQEGTITVATPVSWSANTTLILQAAGSIAVNAAVTATGNTAGLVLEYGAGKDYSVTAPITLSGDSATLQIGPTGSLAAYTLLHAVSDIDDIDFNRGSADRTGNYALAQSLDGDGNTYNNALVDGRFVGTFAGLGNTIANLTIDASSTDGIGLFSNAGPGSVIRDLTVNGTMTGGAYTGGLAGHGSGRVTNVNAAVAVTGVNYVGGLIGEMTGGSVTDSSATGAVTGQSYIGGLIGRTDGPTTTLTRVHATGGVTNTASSGHFYNGGLVGYNNAATIESSYATGDVRPDSGVGNNSGGLVGENTGTIRDSYATGSVPDSWFAGGLVGNNYGDISRAYATGPVGGDGINFIGGLVGSNYAGTLSNVYAAGSVTGNGPVGGLIGYIEAGSVTDAFASGDVSSSFSPVGGLIGDLSWGVSVTRAYATGAVSATVNGAGGLVGRSGGTLSQVYATGTVNGTSDVGGLIGHNDGTVTQAYATGAVSGSGSDIGGLIGSNTHTVTASYWDTDTTGQASSAGGSGAVGLTTADMQNQGSFDGWDWTVWARPEAGSYRPELYGVSGVVGGIRNITYGDDPAGATASTVGDGWWNAVTGTLSVGTLTATDAGTYALAVSGASGTFRTGGATRFAGAGIVNRAALTVTADGGTMTYGDTPPTTITYTATGWKNGQDSTLLTGVTTATTATATSNVGSHTTSASGGTLGGAATGNYTLSYANGTMSVTPATLTVTAADGSMTYGGSVPATGYTTAGWKNGQGDTLLTGVTTATTATATSNVGRYAATTSGGTLGGGAAGNYTIIHQSGTLSVTARPITVTADSTSRVYGNANPVFTYSVGGDGLVNGDTLSGALATSATASSPVGSYAIGQGTLAASSNYRLAVTPGTLSVTARPITVTADSTRRLYGNANPAFTYSVGGDGLVNGDTLSGDLATSATASSPAGSYLITQGTLAASANYALAYGAGVLTVQPADSGNSGSPTNAPPQEVTRQVIVATLPRNMVETTVQETNTALSGGKTVLSGGDSAPTAGTQSAVASATPGADTQGGSGTGMREDEGSAGCVGGAAGAACASQPHPANTRAGRFLRFFQQP